MTMDSADDLHYAEELLGGADLLDGYCRPSCGDRDDPGECTDVTCGCPCGHPSRRYWVHAAPGLYLASPDGTTTMTKAEAGSWPEAEAEQLAKSIQASTQYHVSIEWVDDED